MLRSLLLPPATGRSGWWTEQREKNFLAPCTHYIQRPDCRDTNFGPVKGAARSIPSKPWWNLDGGGRYRRINCDKSAV